MIAEGAFGRIGGSSYDSSYDSKKSTASGDSSLTSTDISNDSLSDVDIGSFEEKLSASGAKRSANMNSVRQMAAATGLRIDFVYGIQTRESGGKESAMALNPHLLSVPDTKWATDVGINEEERKRIIKEWKNVGVETRKPIDNPENKYSGSYFNAHTTNKDVFDKMYTISPIGTITGAALGLYQVLGWFMLSDYGNDGAVLYDDFKNNPLSYSNKSFVKWVNHKSNAKFKKLVNDGESNWREAVKKYYGGDSTDYTNHVIEYAKYFRESLGSLSKNTSKSNRLISHLHLQPRSGTLHIIF